MLPENHLSSKFSTRLQALLLVAIIAETNAFFTFLPAKKKIYIYHSCFIFLPTTTARLWFPRTIGLYLCSKLFPCIPWHHCPEQHALMQFLVNSEGAINPPCPYTHPCARRGVTSPSFVQEGGRGAGRWPAAGGHAAQARRESFNGISTQGEKKQESTRFTEKSLY